MSLSMKLLIPGLRREGKGHCTWPHLIKLTIHSGYLCMSSSRWIMNMLLLKWSLDAYDADTVFQILGVGGVFRKRCQITVQRDKDAHLACS